MLKAQNLKLHISKLLIGSLIFFKTELNTAFIIYRATKFLQAEIAKCIDAYLSLHHVD